MNVLWLCSWYPNEYDHYTGDFIQRQAQAVATVYDIEVLYVHNLANETSYKKIVLKNYTEHIYYIKKSNKLWSWVQYFYIHYRFIKKHKPQRIQVNIAMKSGIVAWLIQKILGIPYIVSEHYGIYNTQVVDNIYKRSFLFKFFTKKIFRKAAAIVAVSNSLAQDIREFALVKKINVISNVVNEDLFNYSPKIQQETFRFIHVSGMDENKNVLGILKAVLLLKTESKQKFEVIFIGAKPKSALQFAAESELLNTVCFFNDAIPYEQVATAVKKSNCLILFSRSETQSCVILESLCTGTPVISSAVGGTKELLNQHNGIYVQNDNVEELKEAMQQMMRTYKHYDTQKISERALKQYAQIPIAKKFQELYNTI